MSFLQLTVHCKELETEGIACNCSLFNPITSCGLWGQELNHWQRRSNLSTFPGHAPTDMALLPWAPATAWQSCGSDSALPSHPWSHLAGFQREPGDNRPCVSSPRGLPGWPRRLCQGAAGKRCPGESWGCQWGHGHLENGHSLHQWGCWTGCPCGRAKMQVDISDGNVERYNSVLFPWVIDLSPPCIIPLFSFVFPLCVKHSHGWWKRNERC